MKLAVKTLSDSFLSPADHFALQRARLRVVVVEQIRTPIRPLRAAELAPKILHAPKYDEILENSTVRATNLLVSLLATLEARDAIVENSARIDRI